MLGRCPLLAGHLRGGTRVQSFDCAVNRFADDGRDPDALFLREGEVPAHRGLDFMGTWSRTMTAHGP